MERPRRASLLSSTDPIEDAPSIGYVCPLYTELVAVLATFDEGLGSCETETDDYYYGRVGNRKAVAVHFPYGDMGPQTAYKCAERMLKEYPSLNDPQSICLLVGIAGGVWTKDRDIRLGDVFIATRIWSWRDGKQTEYGLESTNDPEKLSDRLRRKVARFLYDQDVLGQSIAQSVELMRRKDGANGLRWTYPGRERDNLYLNTYVHTSGCSCATHNIAQTIYRPPRDEEYPKVHSGLVASGNVVLKDSKYRALLQERGVSAVEMEACGVPNNFFVVRGISDYADSHKNDMWQPYAAAVAAACARLLIESFVNTVHQRTMHFPRPISNPSAASSSNHPRQERSSPPALPGSDDAASKQIRVDLHSIDNRLPTVSGRLRPPIESDRPSSHLPSRSISYPVNDASPRSDLMGTTGVARKKANASSLVLQAKASLTAEARAANIQAEPAASIADSFVPFDSFDTPAIDQAGTTENVAHPLPQSSIETCYLESWSCASVMVRRRDDSVPGYILVHENSWEQPLVTLKLHKLDPTYASMCFLTFVTAEMEDGLYDCVWLPSSDVQMWHSTESELHIRSWFEANDGNNKTSVLSNAASESCIEIILTADQTITDGRSLLVERILTVCRSIVAKPVTSNSLLETEIVCNAISLDRNNVRHVLYKHAREDGTETYHSCKLMAFSPRLTLQIQPMIRYGRQTRSANSISLAFMQTLQYSRVPIVISCRAKAESILPLIEVEWKVENGRQVLRRPPEQNLLDTLNEVVRNVSGWTAINVTHDINIVSWGGTSTPDARPFFSKKLGGWQWKPSSRDLQVWQCGEAIRMFSYVCVRGMETDRIKAWTLRAKQGEILVPSDAGFKLEMGFELKTRSRQGYHISLTKDNWFDLPEGYRDECGNSIVIKFPDYESYDSFRQSIPAEFWRKAAA